ncbi:hypothetical protein [Chitinophaga flava]|uniref:Uncharacterized protein n=1 Tax=Chitinophaga flava TaxID=2259036 RepID=A0A365XRX8_9BACT|nr:hypothetical protein [Chitinophaga flava]RBL88900.1 hypothetical protein DF182_20335 [Chitinophaga flava]
MILFRGTAQTHTISSRLIVQDSLLLGNTWLRGILNSNTVADAGGNLLITDSAVSSYLRTANTKLHTGSGTRSDSVLTLVNNRQEFAMVPFGGVKLPNLNYWLYVNKQYLTVQVASDITKMHDVRIQVLSADRVVTTIIPGNDKLQEFIAMGKPPFNVKVTVNNRDSVNLLQVYCSNYRRETLRMPGGPTVNDFVPPLGTAGYHFSNLSHMFHLALRDLSDQPWSDPYIPVTIRNNSKTNFLELGYTNTDTETVLPPGSRIDKPSVNLWYYYWVQKQMIDRRGIPYSASLYPNVKPPLPFLFKVYKNGQLFQQSTENIAELRLDDSWQSAEIVAEDL